MSVKQKHQEKNKMSEIDDQILKYFEIKKRLGKGAYGIVWKALDKTTEQIVAVKKIFDAFRNETDAQRTFREIMFLRAFRNHPNVIQLNSIYKASNNLDIYLSFEFMESDLHNVIKRGTILKDVHKRYVMYQLFNAIKYIHSGNVIHRDLKPSNVLVDSKCRCKIADFGLARSVSQRQFGDMNSNIDPSEPILTDYVATRWYRAPEILVASKRYTKGIDLWSLGCILGEMIRGKPLFPGSSTVNQIERIISALPEASESEISAVGAGFGSVLLNQQINSNCNPKLDDLLSGSPDDAKNLVKSLLILDPANRLTAKQALNHKYVEKFRHTIPEAELYSDVLPPFRDDVQLTVPEYRSKLYEIMQTTEKGGISKSTTTKKKDISTTTKINSSLTMSSTSKNNNGKNNSIGKSTDMEKRSSLIASAMDNQPNLRKIEKKNYILPTNNSANMNKSYKDINQFNGYSNQPISTGDYKFRPISKKNYCKISSIPDSKISSGSSESSDAVQHRTNSLNIISKTNNYHSSQPIEKRHSIDCGYTEPSTLYQSISEKNNNLHSSYTSLTNTRNIKNTKANSGRETEYTSWTSKYSRQASLLHEDTFQNDIKLDSFTDKGAPPVKMTKASDLSNLSSDSGSYYERRLRNLEDKIQQHKMDINILFAQNSKHNKLAKSDNCKITATNSSANFSSGNGKYTKTKVNLIRSKSENTTSIGKQGSAIRYDYTFPEGDRLNNSKRRDEYGIITAKDLFDLRKSQVIS